MCPFTYQPNVFLIVPRLFLFNSPLYFFIYFHVVSHHGTLLWKNTPSWVIFNSSCWQTIQSLFSTAKVLNYSIFYDQSMTPKLSLTPFHPTLKYSPTPQLTLHRPPLKSIPTSSHYPPPTQGQGIKYYKSKKK